MAQLFTNNATSTLASGILSGATSLTVATGDGAKFPATSGGTFLATLYQTSAGTEINHEIVNVTARTGDVLTITRAQEGTTARAFNTGDPVELRLTAGFVQGLNGTTGTNTGNETVTTIKAALGITTLSGSNTGDETATTIKAALGITTLSGSNTGDQTNISGNAATVTTNANLTGDVTSTGNATTLAAATVTGKAITGFTSGAGTVAATDTILGAIQKLDGNTNAKASTARAVALAMIFGG